MSDANVTQRPWSGFAIVSAAYVLALMAAQIATRVAPADWNVYAVVAGADAIATVVVFAFSRAFNNSSVYDPYWSVAPVVIALWLWVTQGEARFEPRQVMVLTLVSAYGVRLTFNWARGWNGFAHEDWRYVDMRKTTGQLYWLVSLLALHYFPTVMTYLGSLPLFTALSSREPVGVLDVVAALVTAAAILIESFADEQLRRFRRSKKADGAICDLGLWRYSRHPNYFGEILFWVGLWLFGVSAGAPWWAGAGFVTIAALFAGASIPMAEKRSLKRRPHYAEHQRRVSMLIPWPPKSS